VWSRWVGEVVSGSWMSRRATGRCWRRAHQRRRRPLPGGQNLPHEFGHIRADHEHRFPDHARDRICRGQAEIEAESIAYLVTTQAGLDAADYSVPYLAGWSGGDSNRLRVATSTAVGTARVVLASLQRPGIPGDPLGEAPTTALSAAPCSLTRSAVRNESRDQQSDEIRHAFDMRLKTCDTPADPMGCEHPTPTGSAGLSRASDFMFGQ
jgi:hypothetical protein